ncbi:MAG: imelysin family protein [Myxococcota bacterium]
MQRRALISGSGAWATLSLIGLTHCQRAPRREEVLVQLVREVMVPETRALVKTSEHLRHAVSTLSATPTLASLGFARTAFAQALLAWKAAQCFKSGPLVETNALVRASFWPARPAAIESLVNGADAIDPARVEALGVDVKGLYALEYLLYPVALSEEAALALLSSEPGRRRLRLADALASDIYACSARANTALGNGSDWERRFSQASKQGIDKVVTQMIATAETLAVNHIGSVLGLAESNLLKPSDVEGAPSQLSQRLVLTELEAIEKLYRAGDGDSLSALVRGIAARIDDRVQRAFAEARHAVSALGAPLEVVVKRDRTLLSRALAATKALEIALKVELASALGVTLTFQMGDGD